VSPISQRKVRQLHANGENSRLDYKLLYNLREDTAKSELAKDVCAIANYLYQTSGQGETFCCLVCSRRTRRRMAH